MFLIYCFLNAIIRCTSVKARLRIISINNEFVFLVDRLSKWINIKGASCGKIEIEQFSQWAVSQMASKIGELIMEWHMDF